MPDSRKSPVPPQRSRSNVTALYSLTETESKKLVSAISRRSAELARCGFSPEEITKLIHLDIDGAHERRACICPYEQHRVRLILADALHFPEPSNLGPWFGTVGDPKLRLRPRDIDQFSPDKVLRRWRTGLQKLRKIRGDIFGVCMVELQLCRALDRPGPDEARHFFEPHFHFVIHGATEKEVKSAFRVRPNRNVTFRKRAVKIQSAYYVDGAISYLTKFKPHFRPQYLNKKGNLRWGKRRIPKKYLRKWLRVMSRFSIHELLSTTGFSVRFLSMPGVAELATSSSRNPPILHRGSIRGHRGTCRR